MIGKWLSLSDNIAAWIIDKDIEITDILTTAKAREPLR